MNYTNAPISELICGVTFNNGLLNLSNLIYEIIIELSTEYPLVSCEPPIYEEELQNNRLTFNIDQVNDGIVVYRLASLDKKWLVQLQNNFVLLNWIRQDDQRVGNYPGFAIIYERFEKIFKTIADKLNKKRPDIDIYNSIKNCNVTYQDRINWPEHITELSNINQILKIQIPTYKGINNTYSANNFFSKYTFDIKEVNGFAILSINSATSIVGRQLLIIENRLKGKPEGDTINEWFAKANQIQSDFFESFVENNILLKWKN